MIKLYEEFSKNPINLEKLKKYADAIKFCCDGEYGSVHYNPTECKILIILGDSSPFDEGSLIEYMKQCIAKDYSSQKLITIEIENEIYPPSGSNWVKF